MRFSVSRNRFIQIFSKLSIVTLGTIASAWAVEFRAEVDRTEVAQDESVSLKLSVESEGSVPIETPEFNAPDFEEIQSYQGSFVQSHYDSTTGKVGAKFSRSFTYVLRPKKTGNLSIEGIKIRVDGKDFSSPAIQVRVSGGGAGTPPPRGYGGGGSGLRGAAKRKRGTALFLRTEIDRTKAYRGQQIVVNYYLYSRVRNFNATADRYPTLNGFLKEELDIPILTGRLSGETVVLDGTAYRRVLLASFAAYPLKEGRLTVDPMEVKATYVDDSPSDRDDDPFGDDDLFRSFFRSAAPRVENLRSEPVQIEVLPLGAVPSGMVYSGAVGEFEVVSAVDRTELKANEALTLTLKIEGVGNLSSIETPKIQLPEGFDLYEAKSQTKGKAGIGERIFEYLLIPRKEGEYTLPGVGIVFFNPKRGEYVRKETLPISIRVHPGTPGAENQAPARMDPSTLAGAGSDGANSTRIFDLLPAFGENNGANHYRMSSSQRVAFFLFLFGGALLTSLWVFRKRILKWWDSLGADSRKKRRQEKEWERIRTQAEGAERIPFREVLGVFVFMEKEIETELFECFGIVAKGMTKAELRESLLDSGSLSSELWERLATFLEFAETLRFGSQAGVVSENRVRNELKDWVKECESILQGLRALKSGIEGDSGPTG